MQGPGYASYLSDGAGDPPFAFIEPPFQQNAPGIAKYPPEVSGHYLLRCMAGRLGWPSLAGKSLIDFGCGVRFARTLVNLGLEIDRYAGLDVNADIIAWLRENVTDPRFSFAHLDAYNPMYNPAGRPLGPDMVSGLLGPDRFDAACMFSVITHQLPDDATRIFRFLRPLVKPAGQLYFTAIIDETVESHVEKDPIIGLLSTYNPDYLAGLATEAGWRLDRIYRTSKFQQWAFVCTRRE